MGESEPEEGSRHGTSVFMREDDSRFEGEFEYFWDAPIPSDPYEREGDRWWSPEPPEPSSEEDEEEVRYLTKVLELEPHRNEAKLEKPSSPERAKPCKEEGCQAPPCAEQGLEPSEAPGKVESPRAKKTRRKAQEEGDEGRRLPAGASKAGRLAKRDAH